MVLVVDFNMREADGRLPALLIGESAREIALGASVTAADGEGLECTARVSEVSDDGRYAMLEPVGDFRDSEWRPAVGDVFAGY